MSFNQTIETHFAGAIPETQFLEKSYSLLSPYGFTKRNTIACIGVCRDELTQSLIDLVRQRWGESFRLAGLGGMLFLGKTGITAALHHAPIEEGRERYVFYVMPHIAIGADGDIGTCFRAGRPEPSSACGALAALQQQLASGKLSSPSGMANLDQDDIEQSLLTDRLLRALSTTSPAETTLLELTKLTHQVILEDLERLIELTVDLAQSDYAVFSGIQIHGPNHQQLIWPAQAYVFKQAQQTNLQIT